MDQIMNFIKKVLENKKYNILSKKIKDDYDKYSYEFNQLRYFSFSIAYLDSKPDGTVINTPILRLDEEDIQYLYEKYHKKLECEMYKKIDCIKDEYKKLI